MKRTASKVEKYHLHKAHPEKIQFELYDLNSYRKKSGVKAALPHSHSYYQLIWFFDSGGKHTVDFETYDVKANTVFFISKDQIHAFDDKLEVQGWLLHFNELFFMHSDIDIFLKYTMFNSGQRPNCQIDKKTAEIAASYIALIEKEQDEKNHFGHEAIIRFLLKALLIQVERIHVKNRDEHITITNRYQLQYFRFKELVEQKYAFGWSVARYAATLNISTKTLTTITKAVRDEVPSKIIMARTVLEAKRFLNFTSLQIGEVGYKLGFNDASYFMKFFKRATGVSPSAYRNR